MKQMKDSGIEWIGQIPEDWEVLRVKDIAKIRTGGTESRADGADNYSTDFGMLWIKPNDLQEFKIIDKTSEYLNDKAQANIVAFPPYTFFVCCIGSIGKFGLTNKKAYCNQQINGIIIDDTEIKKFCMYAIMSQVGQHWYFATGNVVKILNAYNQGRIYIAKPNKNEQQKIANFLDDKCAKIDRLIDYEQATIDELKAYKQSVITEAVTKGLDKSVSMKDSGVEWIGKIPESWSISKIKMLADETQENAFIDGDWIESPYIEDTGIRYLTTGNIGDGVFKRQGNGFISNETFTKLQCKYAYPQDLIFSRLNEEYGRSCILPNDYDKYVIAVDNVILRTNEDKKYICYVTQCSNYHKAVFFYARGTAMKRISRTNLGNVAIPLPSIAEQQQIADYLDKKCADIDSLISIKQK